MKKLIVIVAHTEDRGIGLRGALPWPKISDDLRHFKKRTEGKSVIMGRKTYESIGKILSNRQNIVLTKSKIKGVDTAKTKQEALSISTSDEVFIIGGGEIYKLFLNDVDELDVLIIKRDYKTDTKFPKYEHIFKTVLYEKDVCYKNEKGEDIQCKRKRLLR